MILSTNLIRNIQRILSSSSSSSSSSSLTTINLNCYHCFKNSFKTNRPFTSCSQLRKFLHSSSWSIIGNNNQTSKLNQANRKFSTDVHYDKIQLEPCINSFKAKDAAITVLDSKDRSEKPEWDKLVFGTHCSDHMIEIHWNVEQGWQTPQIVPVHPFCLHPYAKVFHYACELFEGMKAYRGPDNRIRLFRPELNMKRMRLSASRICLPDFDSQELIDLIKKLLIIDNEWIPPYESQSSLYIRPTFIATDAAIGVSPATKALLFVVTGPVGPYFATGFKPVSLLADPKYVRAWQGGSGDRKLGSNYAPTLYVQQIAAQKGLQQVLWLYGDDHQLTEVGTMNIFMLIKNADGKKQLITPPLTEGLILPGVTRQSLIELVRSWNEIEVIERTIPMAEVKQLLRENRLIEMFGAGTACIVCPIGEISYQNELLKIPGHDFTLKLFKELLDIQYGLKKFRDYVQVIDS